MKPLYSKIIVVLLALILFPACLKTRAQLRLEDDGIPQYSEEDPVGRNTIDEMRAEITRMTGRLEELERNSRDRQSEGAEKEEKRKQEINKRLKDIEEGQKTLLEALRKLEARRKKERSSKKIANVKAFGKGKAAYKKKHYKTAVKELSKYLSGKLDKNAAAAYYLRGQANFNSKKYRQAIRDYATLTEKYPKDSAVPEALYKIGLSFERLGLRTDGMAFYQELVDKFPKTGRARSAKKKITAWRK